MFDLALFISAFGALAGAEAHRRSHARSDVHESFRFHGIRSPRPRNRKRGTRVEKRTPGRGIPFQRPRPYSKEDP